MFLFFIPSPEGRVPTLRALWHVHENCPKGHNTQKSGGMQYCIFKIDSFNVILHNITMTLEKKGQQNRVVKLGTAGPVFVGLAGSPHGDQLEALAEGSSPSRSTLSNRPARTW